MAVAQNWAGVLALHTIKQSVDTEGAAKRASGRAAGLLDAGQRTVSVVFAAPLPSRGSSGVVRVRHTGNV